MNQKNDEIPINEAAGELQTTHLNVLMHIKRGKLSGGEKNGVWYVYRDSLDQLLATTGAGPDRDIICRSHSCGRNCGGCG